ncbi:MAG: hypothetical protein MUP86_02155 [Dehalococcoidia bacterium]|nr:hypothetical protein [Dehalococcoidia bacterium]
MRAVIRCSLGHVTGAAQNLIARWIIMFLEPRIKSRTQARLFPMLSSPTIDVVNGQSPYQCLTTTSTLGATIGIEGGEFVTGMIDSASRPIIEPPLIPMSGVIGLFFFPMSGTVGNVAGGNLLSMGGIIEFIRGPALVLVSDGIGRRVTL